MVPQSPHHHLGTSIDLVVQDPLQDSKSISGKLLHRLANLSYTSKKSNKRNNSNKQWKEEKKKDRITMSNSENFLHNPLDHLSTLPRTTLSTRPRPRVQPNHPFHHQPQFRTTMQQQDPQMSPHRTTRATCQMSSPTEDHTNIIVNPYSSSQALLMDRNNYCDMNLQEYNSGLQEYNYASVVNEMGDTSSPFVTRSNLQSPSRVQKLQHQQQRHPGLNLNPINSHHTLVSPQLARLTRTLRHSNHGNGIYGGSTSSACTSSPNKTLLSSLSSASCSPRSDMMRYQNTASILSNSTEMSDLNGSSMMIYQDRNHDDTLPLGTVLYDSNYGDSASSQHVYCEIPAVPPPPPAPCSRNPKYRMNSNEEGSFFVSNNIGEYESSQCENEAFHEELSHGQERKNCFINSKIISQQQCLTPYEEEFIKQNKASSSSSKLNGSPARRSCQSGKSEVNSSCSPLKSPRRFVSVETNATKFTNNVINMAGTRSPKKKNRLTNATNAAQMNNVGEKREVGDENLQINHESRV